METQRGFASKIFVIIVLLLSLLGVGAYLLTPKEALPIGNNFFWATFSHENKSIQVTLANPVTGIIKVKSIELPDQITKGVESTTQHASNSVQFNPKTGDIFFHTTGKLPIIDGYTCGNKDGTCVDRIYKMNIEDGTLSILFEFKSSSEPAYSVHWIVSQADNSLLLSQLYYGGEIRTQVLKKIDVTTGKVLFTTNENLPGAYFEPSLSPGNAYFYQITERSDNDYRGPAVATYFKKIDTQSGKTFTKEIHRGPWGTNEVKISPNGKFVAFYAHPYPLPRDGKDMYLNIYDTRLKKITYSSYVDAANLKISWSGDSSKILLLRVGQTSYIDMGSKKIVDFPALVGQKLFMYAWADSSRYFLYNNTTNTQKIHVQVFDTTENRIIDPPIGKQGDIVLGYLWY